MTLGQDGQNELVCPLFAPYLGILNFCLSMFLTFYASIILLSRRQRLKRTSPIPHPHHHHHQHHDYHGSLFLVHATFWSLGAPIPVLTVLLFTFGFKRYESAFVATSCLYLMSRTVPFTIFITFFAYHSRHRLGVLLGIVTALASAFFLAMLMIGSWTASLHSYHENNPLDTAWAYIFTNLNTINQIAVLVLFPSVIQSLYIVFVNAYQNSFFRLNPQLTVLQYRTIICHAKSLRFLSIAIILQVIVRLILFLLILTDTNAATTSILCKTDTILRTVWSMLSETCLYVLLLRWHHQACSRALIADEENLLGGGPYERMEDQPQESLLMSSGGGRISAGRVSGGSEEFRRPEDKMMQLKSRYRDIEIDIRDVRLERKPFAVGGSGQCYKGVFGGEEIVAKMICDDLSEFDKEVRNLMEIRHPHIVRFYGVCLDHSHVDRLLIITEYVASDLETLIRKPMFDFFVYARQLCQTIAFLHKRDMIHRDLKPGNILVDHRDQIKICDLGLATLSRSLKTASTFCTMTPGVGTPIFSLPPELIAPKPLSKHDPKKIDIFSLAMLLWFMWFKTFPFQDRRDMNDIQILVAMAGGLRPPLGAVSEEQQQDMDMVMPTPRSGQEAKEDDESPSPRRGPRCPWESSPMPYDLAKLIQRMWHATPSERPTIEEVCEELERLQQLTARLSSVDSARSSISLDLLLGKALRESIV